MQNVSTRRKLQHAIMQLSYWQKELQAQRTARRPKKATVLACWQKVQAAKARVDFWQDQLVAERHEVSNRLNVWRAFLVPTEFATEARHDLCLSGLDTQRLDHE